MTTVTRGSNCPHLLLNEPLSELVNKFRGSSCHQCPYKGKNQWLCLYTDCYFVGCGSKGGDHGTTHSLTRGHPVSVNLHNKQVFCQQCNTRVSISVLPSARHVELSTPNTTYSDVSDADDTPAIWFHPEGDLDSNRKPIGTSGLPNLGNTCYMNAALQALSNCPQLTEYFLQCARIFTTCRSSLVSHYIDFTCRLWSPARPEIVSPVPLVDEVKYLFPVFSGYAQHDSQEFLRIFLNHLHEEIHSFLTTPTSPGCAAEPTSSEADGDKEVEDQRTRLSSSCSPNPTRSSPEAQVKGKTQSQDSSPIGRSIITDVFQGKLISAVRCLSCDQISCREEVFLDLSLSLVRPNADRTSEKTLLTKPHNPVTDECAATSIKVVTPSADIPQSSTEAVAKTYIPLVSTLSFIEPFIQLSSDALPLAKRKLFQLFDLFAISLSWVFARLIDIQAWLNRPALTLNDCLLDYFSVSKLDGQNMYYCQHCKKHSNGLNQTALFCLPEVLCLHLKRFRTHNADASKISTSVVFPLEDLEMRPFLHPDCTDQVTTYDLIGIISHRGGCGGGHYVAYAKNWIHNAWFEFDDDRVCRLRPSQVEQLTTDAYVLFYRKKDRILNPIRRETEQLLREYSLGCEAKTVYLNRYWFIRFCTGAEPGPISNAEFLCEHKYIRPQFGPDRDSWVVEIPEALWFRLIQYFGGGPMLRDFSVCSNCCEALLARQNREFNAFNKAVQRSNLNGDACSIYAISTVWFESWKDFLQGRTLRVPGRIDNSDIVDYGSSTPFFSSAYHSPSASSTTIRRQPQLKLGSAYSHIPGDCWDLLWSIYGGGPTICIRRAQPVLIVNNKSPASEEMSDSQSSSPYSSTHNHPSSRAGSIVLSVNSESDMQLDQPICTMRNGSELPSSSEKLYYAPNSANTNHSMARNGDTESGVFSTDLASSSFSSVTAPNRNHRTGSLSVDNLSALAKGDWNESTLSLDGAEDSDDNVSSGSNGFHRHSYDQLSTSINPMAGDSVSPSKMLLCNGTVPKSGKAAAHLPVRI